MQCTSLFPPPKEYRCSCEVLVLLVCCSQHRVLAHIHPTKRPAVRKFQRTVSAVGRARRLYSSLFSRSSKKPLYLSAFIHCSECSGIVPRGPNNECSGIVPRGRTSSVYKTTSVREPGVTPTYVLLGRQSTCRSRQC